MVQLTDSLTSIHMIQESVNKTADKKLWDKEIQRELAEHRERHFANREVEIEKYEQDLQIWKDVNRKYILSYIFNVFFTITKLFRISLQTIQFEFHSNK